MKRWSMAHQTVAIVLLLAIVSGFALIVGVLPRAEPLVILLHGAVSAPLLLLLPWQFYAGRRFLARWGHTRGSWIRAFNWAYSRLLLVLTLAMTITGALLFFDLELRPHFREKVRVLHAVGHQVLWPTLCAHLILVGWVKLRPSRDRSGAGD